MFREDHADVQGQVFTEEEFDKLQNNELATDIDGGTHLLDKRIIGQYNCRHMAAPFLIGINERSFTPEQLDEINARNEKGIVFDGKQMSIYEATQCQRALESEMRRTREELNMLKELRGADPRLERDYQQCRKKMLGLQMGYAKLGNALKPVSIREKWDRASVPRGSFSNSIAGQSYNKTDLMKSALQLREGGEHTQLGRAFQKHNKAINTSRDNTFVGRNTANPEANTKMGLEYLQKMFNNRATTYEPDPKKVMQLTGGIEITGVIRVRLPSGEGAMWSIDGKHFIGLLSKY